MKILVQRVLSAKLIVDGHLISEIDKGLSVYVGVCVGDDNTKVLKVAKKIVNMRIFEDQQGKMNLSILDKGYQILLISNFTLCGDALNGNRPNFSSAEKPQRANELYSSLAVEIKKFGIDVKLGVFGADMKINQENDGPVSVIFDI